MKINRERKTKQKFVLLTRLSKNHKKKNIKFSFSLLVFIFYCTVVMSYYIFREKSFPENSKSERMSAENVAKLATNDYCSFADETPPISGQS